MLFVSLMARRSQIIALKNCVKLLHVCCNLMRVKLTVRPTLRANAIAPHQMAIAKYLNIVMTYAKSLSNPHSSVFSEFSAVYYSITCV
ncbi:hypothetical protein ACF3DV_17555 [Chlorogloeopsis fritschii PCC 9212]|uniref:hypothetical protein n=1 Tax=Chlorogloeopsis fritschii TaxID=1124 RepID=UPI0012FD4FEF|nr:hypothetical protein [Chlorogloeopsis fritschii]